MFSTVPVASAAASMMPTDLSPFLPPSSRNSTTKVAMHGKNIAKSTVPIISCFTVTAHKADDHGMVGGAWCVDADWCSLVADVRTSITTLRID